MLGFGGWLVLVLFFVSWSAIGRYACRVIHLVGAHMQEIANGARATICAVLDGLTGPPFWPRALAATIAESNPDT
jgi:uncharacterized membrane protein